MPLALAMLCACAAGAPSHAAARELDARALRYEIVAKHPHDARSFTQGLALLDAEHLVESSGLYGRSAVSVRRIATGAEEREHRLDHALFGEGLAIGAGRILQLTWREGVALSYDTSLRPTGRLRYDGEGWGLAFDGARWLMSDGSDRITVRRREDFARVATVRVTHHGRPLRQLNELEFADGWLYANVWMTDRIAVIDPRSGIVRAWLDLAALRDQFSKPAGWDPSAHVLNGIAHDPRSGHFYVTGKCWPALFELKVQPMNAPPEVLP